MTNTPDLTTSILALDAMGVLYEAADDVAELLVPFVRGRVRDVSADVIERAYIAASLGEIDADQFWRRVGLDPLVEDEYLSGHRLNTGVVNLLAEVASYYDKVCCLSNDVSRWSLKLRRTFRLEQSITPFVISADVGARKPSHAIYEELLRQVDAPAQRILFVDDRVRNLDTAHALGFRTVLFDPSGTAPQSDHPRIEQLAQLRK